MKDIRVFFACFFGALIGGLIAREVGSGLWWIGSIAGFVVGYLSYEFRQVIDGVRTAWNAIVKIDFKKMLRSGLNVVGVVLVMIVSLILFLVCLHGALISWAVFSKLITEQSLGGFSNEYFDWVSIATWFGLSVYVLFVKTKKEDTIRKYIVVSCNPFIFFGFLIPRVVFLVIKTSPKWILATGKFFIEAFRYIHSDVRLLCGIDAAIGAVVGYFTGDILIGAFFGGLFGLLNYKIVRTYILKISPQESVN